MLDRLLMIEKRYNEINDLLIQPEVVCDIKRLTELSKEQRSLEKIVILFQEQKKLEASIPDLKEMKKEDDPEIAEMAEIEIGDAQLHRALNDSKLTAKCLAKLCSLLELIQKTLLKK